MSSVELILLIVTCLAAVASLGFVVFAVTALRKQPAQQVATLTVPQTEIVEIDVADNESTNLVAAEAPSQTVITHLSFEESFDAQKFAETSQQIALSDIARTLGYHAADGISITVNSVRLMKSSAELVVSASKGTQVLLQDGAATIARHGSGKALPLITDAKTGKVVEIMKEAKGAQVATRAAALGAAVVGAAHIISGADIAKRLKEVSAKIDLLLAYRRIDQVAALERIYTSARELSLLSVNEETKTELWRLRGELRELRIRWRRELDHQLQLIDDPESAAWYSKMFRFIEPVDRAPNTKVHGKITEGQLHISLIEYSLRLDHTLAVASGTLPAFESTLYGELSDLSRVAEKLEVKAALISKKYPDLSVDATTRGLAEVIKQYEKLLPQELEVAPKFVLLNRGHS